jgi:hypothetical protein
MMNTYTHTEDGYTFTCVYEYESPLAADDINPAWEGMVTVCEVYVNGSEHDAHELLNPALIQRIESDIAESLQ